MDLFTEGADGDIRLGQDSWLLRGFAAGVGDQLLDAVERVQAKSPLRHMTTPSGFQMSVAMTNCGELGWVTDSRGYRYCAIDPQTGNPWPAMQAEFRELASAAAARLGVSFLPDACHINEYGPSAKLSLHQDRNEQDLSAPIVSVSLGMSAVFMFGGAKRSGAVRRMDLHHGDTVVWGGVDRLNFHGIASVKGPAYTRLENRRINLTFRRAGPPVVSSMGNPIWHP